MLQKDQEVIINQHLKGSTIIEIIQQMKPFEGGLIIIFVKNDIKGIYIMGYTELGQWTEYFKFKDFEVKTDSYKKAVKSIKKLYGIL